MGAVENEMSNGFLHLVGLSSQNQYVGEAIMIVFSKPFGANRVGEGGHNAIHSSFLCTPMGQS